jgi:hypothetical protein
MQKNIRERLPLGVIRERIAAAPRLVSRATVAASFQFPSSGS